MGFDVDQSEVVKQLETPQSANESQEGAAPESGSAPESKELTPAQKQEILDLEKVEKFKYGGREWTPKDFQGAYMMHSDYTKKTMALAQERKFYDNLSADLEAVKGNPSLIEEFKKVYPEKFHSFLSYVQAQDSQPARQVTEQKPQVDPIVNTLQSRLEQIENHFKEQEVASISAELDAKLSKLAEKYPLADEEAVLSRAEALLSKLQSESPNQKVRISDAQWDQLYKVVNDRAEASYKKRYSQEVQSKVQNNNRAKDVPSGGGIPGQAPKKYRTIKEATDAYLSVMDQQG